MIMWWFKRTTAFMSPFLTFGLNGKSSFTLATHTGDTQTLFADFDSDCNQSGFLSLSADGGDCNMSNLDLLAGTGLGDWGEERRENRRLIIVILAEIKCRYYIIEYSGYFKSPQLLKMLLYDCKCGYSEATLRFVRTWCDLLHSRVTARKRIRQTEKEEHRDEEDRRCICVSIQCLSLACLHDCVCVCARTCVCVCVRARVCVWAGLWAEQTLKLVWLAASRATLLPARQKRRHQVEQIDSLNHRNIAIGRQRRRQIKVIALSSDRRLSWSVQGEMHVNAGLPSLICLRVTALSKKHLHVKCH